MRELTISEVHNVSGAGFFDTIGAMVVGGVTGLTAFGLKWGMSGGSTGGIVGAGIVAAGVGFIVGGILGIVNGAMYGAINGWDTTTAWFNEVVENTFDPNASVIAA